MPNHKLTKDDFLAADIDSVMDGCEVQECRAYSDAFGQKEREAETVGDERSASAFRLLRTVTAQTGTLLCLPVNFGSGAGSDYEDSQTLAGIDFDDAGIAALEQAAETTKNHELLARICDVLWTRRRNYKWAARAIEAYLAADMNRVTPDRPYAACRLIRALDLARLLNKSALEDRAVERIDALLEEMISGVERQNALWSESPSPTFRIAHDLIRAMLDREVCRKDKKGYARYSVLAKRMADKGTAIGARDWVCGYLTLVKDGFRKASDMVAARAAGLQLAESYVAQSDYALTVGATPDYVAASWLESAVQEYRQLGGCNEVIDKLKGRMRDCQMKAVSQMPKIIYRIPVTEEVQQAVQEAVESIPEMSLLDALRSIAFIIEPGTGEFSLPSPEQVNGLTGPKLFPKRFINERGMTTGRLAALGDQAAVAEDDVKRVAQPHTGTLRGYIAHIYIEPMRRALTKNRSIESDDLIPLISGGDLIQPGHEKLIALGLSTGARGDYVEATHLLIPQIENMLRYILKQNGIETTSLNEEGIQTEFDINKMLSPNEACAKKLEAILGEYTVYDLRGLLVSRSCGNLRNEMSHGLMSYDAFNPLVCSYVWWITLRLCLSSRDPARAPTGKADEEADNAEPDAPGTPTDL